MYHIYKYRNIANGMVYIGKARYPNSRYSEHLSHANMGKTPPGSLEEALAEFGEGKFEFVVFEHNIKTEREAYEREAHWIKKYNSNSEEFGYNRNAGGSGGWAKRTSADNVHELFTRRTEKRDNGCLEWVGPYDGEGLPIMRWWARDNDGELVSMERSGRRTSLELAGNPAPAQSIVFSYCEASCVNPEHLYAGDKARFWSKVDKSGECWLWVGKTNSDGVGRFYFYLNGEKVHWPAHRYAYLQHDPDVVNDNNIISHLCPNPNCVRVEHLETVAWKEHHKRCVAKCIEIEAQRLQAIIPSTEVLQKLVWNHPARDIINQLGISEGYFVNTIRSRGITMPPCGYWSSTAGKSNRQDKSLVLITSGTRPNKKAKRTKKSA